MNHTKQIRHCLELTIADIVAILREHGHPSMRDPEVLFNSTHTEDNEILEFRWDEDPE